MPDTNEPLWDVHVVSTEPCAPWDAIPLETAELPTDPTPRILWWWSAPEDADFVRQAARLPFVHLVQPVISPDGSLRLFGPDWSSITALGRDGEFLWVAGPGVGSSEEGFYGLPMVDPEGTTWMISRPASGRGDSALYGYRDGTYRATLELSELEGAQPTVTVGVRGQLVINPGPVRSTCRGTSVEWEATRFDIVPVMSAGRDGSLWAPVRAGRRVSRTGELSPSGVILPTPLVGTNPEVLSTFPIDASAFLVSARFTGGTARSWIGTSGRMAELAEGNTTPIPTGASAAWVISAGSGTGLRHFAHYADGELQGEAEVLTGLTGTHPTQDASLLIVEGPPPSLIRLLSDGTIAWRVPLVDRSGNPMTGADTTLTVDRHGVLYVASGTGLVVAVQTDTLPPPDGTCLVPYCNARRDLAMFYPTD